MTNLQQTAINKLSKSYFNAQKFTIDLDLENGNVIVTASWLSSGQSRIYIISKLGKVINLI